MKMKIEIINKKGIIINYDNYRYAESYCLQRDIAKKLHIDVASIYKIKEFKNTYHVFYDENFE